MGLVPAGVILLLLGLQVATATLDSITDFNRRDRRIGVGQAWIRLLLCLLRARSFCHELTVLRLNREGRIAVSSCTGRGLD